jgi:hypothetical protein
MVDICAAVRRNHYVTVCTSRVSWGAARHGSLKTCDSVIVCERGKRFSASPTGGYQPITVALHVAACCKLHQLRLSQLAQLFAFKACLARFNFNREVRQNRISHKLARSHTACAG